MRTRNWRIDPGYRRIDPMISATDGWSYWEVGQPWECKWCGQVKGTQDTACRIDNKGPYCLRCRNVLGDERGATGEPETAV